MEIFARNSNGFSLVEMLVALVIIAITLLGLAAVTLSSITVNIRNDLRNTGVRLTNQTAEVLLALPPDGIISCGITPDPDGPNYNASYTYSSTNTCLGATDADYKKYPNPVQTVKGFKQNFNITWAVTTLNSNLRQITITVANRYRNENFTNNAVIYRHRTL
jgi:prepilin-type N-terminal cleavage/methylation domain-containing protein